MERNALERRGLKVSQSKTEYLRVGGVDDGEELKLQGEKIKRAKNFKYLGSTVSSDGRCEEEVKRRIQAGWMCWRKVSGVLYDRNCYQQRLRVKCTRVLLDQSYFMEWKQWQEGKMEVAELKMVRWALGVTRKNKIRNEYVRGTAKIAKLGDKLRNAERQTMLVWTHKKERRLRGEKDDGDGGARHTEKRKAKEKVDGFGERRHGKGWS